MATTREKTNTAVNNLIFRHSESIASCYSLSCPKTVNILPKETKTSYQYKNERSASMMPNINTIDNTKNINMPRATTSPQVWTAAQDGQYLEYLSSTTTGTAPKTTTNNNTDDAETPDDQKLVTPIPTCFNAPPYFSVATTRSSSADVLSSTDDKQHTSTTKKVTFSNKIDKKMRYCNLYLQRTCRN